MEIDTIHSRVTQSKPSIQNVRAFGTFKFSITFRSQEEVDEALSLELDVCSSIFEDVRKWSPVEVSQSRRVWLECIGLSYMGAHKIIYTKLVNNG